MDLTADNHSALALPQQKRRKVAPSAEDKQRIKAAATAVYDGMASLFNAEMNQPHMAAFMEPVSKQDYPSYHLLIKRPVHMKMIKKKISMGMYNKDIGKLHDDFSLVCTINLRSWCFVFVRVADCASRPSTRSSRTRTPSTRPSHGSTPTPRRSRLTFRRSGLST